MNFETWWKGYDNVQCDKDVCEDAFYAGLEVKNQNIKELIKSMDWHIEDCNLSLTMNKNDYYKDGFRSALLFVKKRLKEFENEF